MRLGLVARMAVTMAAALAAAPALADVKAGVDAWSRGDFAAAIAQWRGPAASGDADAQFNLAQAYKLGKGVPADFKAAEDLYAKAARAGHLQAADNYGLLLFQTGRRDEAMAWIVPSAERGEPRAQYVLATAHFNGDLVPRDRVRAYALMSSAAAAGLDQARESLAAMDAAIPLAERQQAVALATQLDADAQSLRGAQFAAADLGGKPAPQKRVVGENKGAAAAVKPVTPPKPQPAPQPAPQSAPQSLRPEPVTAGADFANPVTIKPAPTPAKAAARPAQVFAPPAPAKPAPAKPAMAKPAPAPATGAWRVQLGAFSVAGNAEAQWVKLKGRAPLAGLGRFLVPAGGVTRLQAGPFASKAAADAACAALAGQACIPVKP